MNSLENMNKVILYKFIYSILWVIPVFSGITVFASIPSSADSLVVHLREPNPGFIGNYKTLKAFQYSPPPVKPNLIRQLIAFLRGKFRSFDKLYSHWSLIPKIIFWLAVLFCLFLIIRFTRIDRIFYSAKPAQGPVSPYVRPDQSPADFDAEIQKLVEQKHYRMATRFYYIRLISYLKERKLIVFSKDKTSHDYYNEIKSREVRHCFLTATRMFNHVWYGNIQLGEEQFEQIVRQFQLTDQTIDAQE